MAALVNKFGSGHIQVILGPMFSGKTTELIRRMKRFKVANQACMMIKYSKDDRYDRDRIATHDKHVTSAYSCSILEDVKDKVKDFGVIGIDEGQFFPDIVDFCEEMANDGKTVIVAALDGTFQRKAFNTILDLVPLAEKVDKLYAVCMICYGDAAFTKRISAEKEVEVIGGSDKYMAVCRKCYNCTPSDNDLTPTRITPSGGRQLIFSDNEQ